MSFSYRWQVQRADDSIVIDLPPTNGYCRDSAFCTMRNNLTSKFELVSHTDSDDAFVHFIINYGSTLRFTAFFAHDYASTVETGMREYTIPRTIEKLVHKYPTVTFQQVAENVPGVNWNTKKLVHGILLQGDASVIPAFYWAGLIQRHGSVRGEVTSWRDVNMLINRACDETNIEGWNTLCANNEPNALRMLASCYGPSDTFEQSDEIDRRIAHSANAARVHGYNTTHI